MQVPAAESFRHQDGYWVGPPWWVRVPEGDIDLCVSDGDDGPDGDSLALAERVLPRLDEMRAAAVRYLVTVLTVPWIPRMEADNAELVSVFCDGGSHTVILEMFWNPDTDHLWWVEFLDSGTGGLRPVAFGMRGWNTGSRAPWSPPHRSIHG